MSYEEYENAGMKKMMLEKLETGDTKFVMDYFYTLYYLNYKSDVAIEMINKGEVNFVKENFAEFDDSKYKLPVLIELTEKGETEKKVF